MKHGVHQLPFDDDLDDILPPAPAQARPARRPPGRGEYACACGAAACFFFGAPNAPEAVCKAWCFWCAPSEFKPGRVA